MVVSSKDARFGRPVMTMTDAPATAGDDIFHGTDDVDFFSDALGGNDQFYGEGGNDILYASRSTGQTGSVLLDGGNGADRINFASDLLFTDVILRGGEGNDLIDSHGGGTVNIDAGAGADVLIATREGTSYTIALGAGADVVAFSGVDFTYAPGPAMIFTDFEAGAGGDRLALERFLAKSRNWDAALNPFATGHLALVQQGADAVLRIDRDAQDSGFAFVDFAIFRNVSAASLTAENLGFATGGGTTPGLVLTGTALDDQLYGAGGGDQIDGGAGSDTIDGGAGDDVIHGGADHDRIDGQFGDDQLFGGSDGDALDDSNGGSDRLYGEDGADTLTVTRHWTSTGDAILADGGADGDYLYFFGLSSNRVHRLTYLGGAGDDHISIDSGVASAIVDAGDGNDDLTLLVNDADYFVTLGAGADTVQLFNNNFAATLPTRVRFADFQSGVGGDSLEFSVNMLKGKLTTWDGVTDPFSLGLLRLAQRGTATFIQFDRDGDGQGFETLVSFANLNASSLVAANLHGFQPGPVATLGAGDETIVGGDGVDFIDGLDGNDILAGAGGGDTLDGGDGIDTLYAAGISPPFETPFFGNNPVFTQPVLDTGSEVDILRGGAGYDQIFAGYGDNVDGGADSADLYLSLQGATTGQTIDFRQLANGGTIIIGGGTITNIRGVRWIEGSNFDDTLTGTDLPGYQNAFLFPIFGRGGNDHLIGGFETGNLYGGDGNDTLESVYSFSYMYGEAGDDVIVNHGANNHSYGGDGNDTLIVSGSGHGGAGDDTITIGDVFGSGVGNGDEGNDTLNGYSDSSRLAGGTGADIINGNAGGDFLYSAGPADGLFSQFNPSDGVVEGEEDTGSEHDQLFGGDDNDRLSIGYGDDADGGTGANSLALSLLGAGAGIVIDTADIIGGASYVLGGGTIQHIQSVTRLWGSAFGDTITLADQATGATVFGGGGNDTINATSKADLIHGGTGADIIHAGGGNDQIFLDTATDAAAGEQIDGGGGSDVLKVGFGIEVDLSGVILTSIESIEAGFGSNLVSTTTLATVSTLSGAFTFVNGGTVSLGTVTASGTLFLTLSDAGNDINLASVTPTGFMIVTGGSGNDIFRAALGGADYFGGAGNDLLIAGAASDRFDGGAGIDTIDYRNAAAGITASLQTSPNVPGAGPGGDQISNVENINGSAFNDTLNGNNDVNELRGGAGNDTLTGRGGDDLLDGGAGADTMRGGTNNDFYYVDNVGDAVVENANEGSDRIFTSVSYALSTGASVELLTTDFYAGTDAINLTGNELANTIFGNDGANILDGKGAADTLVGRLGDDIYYVDNIADRLIENAGEGNDRVFASLSYTLAAGLSVELMTTTDHIGTAAINLTGNEFANTIFGNDGANILDGGTGADTLVGRSGDDIYYVDNAGDQVFEAAGQGNDRVFASGSYVLTAGAEVELMSTDFHAGTAAINLTGNELANIILGNDGDNILDGGAGADALVGRAGNDWYFIDNAGDQVVENGGEGTDRVFASVSFTLGAGVEVELMSTDFHAGTAAINLTGNELANFILGNDGDNILNGGAGADTLVGRLGNDWFFIDNAGDQVFEAAGEGNDRVFAGVSYTLTAGADVEVMSTDFNAGTAAIDLTGNELANTIYGNDGANILDGKGGSDTLIGRAGNDLFAFTTTLGGGNVDTILDFVAGSDKLQLDHAVFTGLGLGGLGPNAFVVGTQAGDGDDRIIYNQATGQLFFDADGNGAGAAVQFATLLGNPVISASDFVVI